MSKLMLGIVCLSIMLVMQMIPISVYATQYSLTTIDVPGSQTTQAAGLNDGGTVVGVYDNETKSYVLNGGSFTAVALTGATATRVFDVDNSGRLLGWYQDATATHGFLLSHGAVTKLDVPGTTITERSAAMMPAPLSVGRKARAASTAFNI